jgi:hypothetical protein
MQLFRLSRYKNGSNRCGSVFSSTRIHDKRQALLYFLEAGITISSFQGNCMNKSSFPCPPHGPHFFTGIFACPKARTTRASFAVADWSIPTVSRYIALTRTAGRSRLGLSSTSKLSDYSVRNPCSCNPCRMSLPSDICEKAMRQLWLCTV